MKYERAVHAGSESVCRAVDSGDAWWYHEATASRLCSGSKKENYLADETDDASGRVVDTTLSTWICLYRSGICVASRICGMWTDAIVSNMILWNDEVACSDAVE